MINVLNAGQGPVSSSHFVNDINSIQLSCPHKIFCSNEHNSFVEVNVTHCVWCIIFTKT